MKHRDLSDKQRIFVANFLVTLNATKAAIAAGYSEKSARQAGSALRANPNIARAIQQAMNERAGRLQVSADRIVKELARVAFFDPRTILTQDGRIKPPTEWDDDVAAVVAGLDVTELFEGSGDEKQVSGLIKKLKIAGKVAALELLGKHLGLFVERHQISNPDGSSILDPFQVTAMAMKVAKNG